MHFILKQLDYDKKNYHHYTLYMFKTSFVPSVILVSCGYQWFYDPLQSVQFQRNTRCMAQLVAVVLNGNKDMYTNITALMLLNGVSLNRTKLRMWECVCVYNPLLQATYTYIV